MGGAVPRATRAALACLAAFAASGCSTAFMRRPPEGPVPPGQPIECTTSEVAVELDWAGAVAFGLPGLVGLAAVGAPCGADAGPCLQEHLWIGLGSLAALGVAVGYVASAERGKAGARRCLELRCASGVEESCRALPSPPSHLAP